MPAQCVKSDSRYRSAIPALIAALGFSVCSEAVEETTPAVSDVLIDNTWLEQAVSRDPRQQRQLQAAERSVQAAEYTKAFELILQLLRSTSDSVDWRTLPTGTDNAHSILGIRTATLRLLQSLPPSALRDWNAVCFGPGRRLLKQAASRGSRNQVHTIVHDFPMSDIAADATFLKFLVALNRGEFLVAATSMEGLQAMQRKGLLSRQQTSVLTELHGRLSRLQQHAADSMVPSDTTWPLKEQSLISRPNWQLRQSPWLVPDYLHESTDYRTGSRYGQRFGAHRPLAGPNYVLFRTPAGISRVNRRTGHSEWFLPLLSTPQDPRRDDDAAMRLFHTTPMQLQRLERRGSTIFFVDGKPPSHRRQHGGLSLSRRENPGATHLVALHNDMSPRVLWWTSGEHLRPAETPTGHTTDDASRLWPIRQSSQLSPADRSSQTPVAGPSRSGPLFQCAPIVRNGQLYIATRHDDLTSLNCLSARTGEMIWQQPLLTHSSLHDEQHISSVVVGGVSDDFVICLFAEGMVAGVRISDGSIGWLQNVLTVGSAPENATSFALASQAEPEFIPAGDTGHGLGTTWLHVAGDRVICGRRNASVLFCLDASDGSIHWSTSRAVRSGLTNGQYDLSCVGQVGRQLIMAGISHVRAIAMNDGSTTWVRPLGNHQGRIAIHQSCIYAGSGAGRLLGIDGETGAVVSSQSLQQEQMGHLWTVDSTGLLDASAWQVSARAWTKRDSVKVPSPMMPYPSAAVSVRYDINSDAILTPESLGPLESQFGAAESLLNDKRRLECELLLLNIRLKRDANFEDQLRRRNQLLQRVRVPILSPGYTDVVLESTDADVAGPARKLPGVEFEEAPSDGVREPLQNFRMLLQRWGTNQRPDVPSWYVNQFLRVPKPATADEYERTAHGEPRLGLVNPELAQERSSASAVKLSFPRSVAYEESWTNPPLCIVQNDNRIGVLSLHASDPLRPLWMHPLPGKSFGRVIALNSYRIVIVDNDRIQTLHPINGRLLWERHWKDSAESLPMHGQFYKVYQTADHIILLSTLGTASVVLDARNGEIVRTAGYTPRPVSRIVGRYFVFADQTGTLQVRDLVNGDQRGIDVSGVSKIDNAGRLRDGVIMVTTSAPSIVFVDVIDARVISRIDLGGAEGAGPGHQGRPLMIYRAGLMFVAATSRDWRSRTPPATFGEGQTGFGILACIHPDTWHPLWHDTCRTASIPHIFGDPCPWLVTCSSGEYVPPPQGQRNSYAIPNSTTVQIREAATGRTVGQFQRSASSTPLRVTYNATHKQLDFTFADTTIRMKPKR